MRDSSIRAPFLFKRNVRTPRGERELALITIDRVTLTTLALLVILLNAQAFMSDNPITYWQFVFAFLTLISWLYGTLKVRSTGSQYVFLPLFTIFLAAPFVCQPWVTHSWTSYGLIVVATVVYVSALPSTFIAFAFIFLCLVLQALSTQLNLRSLTDNADLSYAGNYFSSTWVLLVGTMLFVIRGKYLKFCNDIDLQLAELEEQEKVRSRNIRLLNSQDSKNLKMHGTVLNTLLVIKGNLESGAGFDQALSRLKKETSDLEGINTPVPSRFIDQILAEATTNSAQTMAVEVKERPRELRDDREDRRDNREGK